MTVKDFSSEIEKLKDINNEKDNLIKMYFRIGPRRCFPTFHICKKINENDQQHFKNEKVLEEKFGYLNTKVVEVTKKKEEEAEEPQKKYKRSRKLQMQRM